VKERLCGGVAGAGSGIGPYLAGAPWWAVALVVFVVMLVTYSVVCWLAANTRAGRISTFLITWEAPSEREPEASPPKRQKWWRSDAA
jgi:cell division protein FtsW (lipid II flippase)